MSRVTIAADRRFHRARVRPPRRRGRWRAFAFRAGRSTAVALAVVFAVYRGTAGLAEARLLQIHRIEVRGNERLSYDDVLAALNGLHGENLVWTDLNAWRQRLLSSPWVRDASLRRVLPATVEVIVSERQPIGIGRIAGDLYLVDERGSIIDQYGPAYADFDLPIIDGLAAPNGPAALGEDPHAQLAARLMGGLRTRPEVARGVSQIDVTDAHNAAVILNGDPAVIYVGEDRFLPRLESYLELASTLRQRVADIDYVDLRFDDRIYVRPVAAKRR
jgi:cell division protein FtsQ